jgi:hypothetical protein
MFKTAGVCVAVDATEHARTLIVTMTNDPDTNQIQVYDADSHALLQTLSTHGKGGAAGNARGIKQYEQTLVAVVNNGSNSVALFRRSGDGLRFEQLVSTTSAPVGTGTHVFIDDEIAAQIPTGSRADVDADAGVLAVIDHGSGQSHLSILSYDEFGELKANGAPITVGVPDANGVAVVSPRHPERK